ncbi:BlaI/MecI/CopY family transcriptional regulator [soil metagenome]
MYIMKKIKLDELQIAIMKVLWELKEATVVQVKDSLKEEDRELAPTTIGTILSRLEKKGVVDHRSEGRLYIYRPLITEEETKSSMVSILLDQLFQGDSTSLVNHLLKESEFDKDELQKLKELIEKSDQMKGGENDNH